MGDRFQEIAQQLNLFWVGLINGWEAGAYGMSALEAKDFLILNPGTRDAQEYRAIISAGCSSLDSATVKIIM